MVVEVNDIELKEMLSNNEMVFVDYYASWCHPCQDVLPNLEKISDKYPQIKFAKYDTDEHHDYSTKHNIIDIPTMIIYKNGEEVGKLIGYKRVRKIADELDAILNK